MYCKYCGQKINETAKFCKYCGEKLTTEEKEYQQEKETPIQITTKEGPLPWKRGWLRILLLSLLTFGVYYIYWYYVTQKHVARELGKHYNLEWRTIGMFIPIVNLVYLHNLFSDIKLLQDKAEIEDKLQPGWCLVSFIVGSIFYLSFAALIWAQSSLNTYWNKEYGDKVETADFGKGEMVLVALSIIFWAIILIGAFYEGYYNPLQYQTQILNQPSVTQRKYPEHVVTNFINACMDNAGTESYCKCAINEFENRYSIEEYLRFEDEYLRTGILPTEWEKIISFCAPAQ